MSSVNVESESNYYSEFSFANHEERLEDSKESDLPTQFFADQIYNELKEFSSVKDGWDGPHSKGPTKNSIDEAIKFVSFWNTKFWSPEPELNSDGAVALQFYDGQNNCCGGIEFRENSLGAFAIMDLYCVIDKGSFKSDSNEEIIRVIARVKKALLNVSASR